MSSSPLPLRLPLLLNLLVPLLMPPLLPVPQARAEPCAELRAAGQRVFHKISPGLKIEERSLRVNGEALPVRVWGGGGAGRAAAAVQLAAARALFGYDARLQPARADLCHLLRAPHTELAALAAAATWPRDGCAGAVHAQDQLVSPAGRAALPVTPLLLARAPDARCAELAAGWTFYKEVGNDARECKFLLSTRNASSQFVVLLRLADEEDQLVEAALQTRVAGMPVELLRFDKDRELRARIAELRRQNESFLFVDDDIWTDDASVVRVQPPPCAPGAAPAACEPALLARNAVRVGDGAFMRVNSPTLANVAAVRLESAELRAVLRLERETRNLTAAGCRWALENIGALLERLGINRSATATVYSIAVLPCADDPRQRAIGDAARGVRDRLYAHTGADYEYPVTAVDCADAEALRAGVAAAARRRNAAGLVAWAAAAGYDAARAAAERAGLPLLAVGAAPADLARALLRTLRLCGWSRAFVVSDRSAYWRGAADALLADGSLVGRRADVDSDADVERALDAVRSTDARVVVVAAGWNVTERVLCGAARLRLGAVWLVRETRAWGACGVALRVLSPDAADEQGAPAAASDAALVDALVRLTLGFDSFLRENPSHLYDFRENSTLILKHLEKVNVTGVAGTDAPPRRAARARTCAALLGAEPPPDRAACATWRTGDAFAPRCQDAPVFLSAAFLALAALALLAAWRVRRGRAARRDREWRRRLEAQRRRAASALVTYVVDRGAVRLLREIGSGCYGRVHRAELRRPDGGTQLVAAKEPREGAAPAEEGELLREACVLAPLAHAHVVRLVGVCLAAGPPLVLLEHARHLDLQRYLRRRRAPGSPALAPRALTRLAREAAGALQYLAGRRLVHRDVRAANCLVDARRSLKLADFGLARELGAAEPEYATTRRGLFPVLWMAPESLEQGVFSPASDVWALGVLLLEVATLGARPFGSWTPAQVLRYVTDGGRPPLPPDLSPHTRDVVLACWQRAPERRPSAASVHAVLAAIPEAVRPALLTPSPPPPLPPLPPPPPLPLPSPLSPTIPSPVPQ